MHDDIVGRVKWFSIPAISQDGDVTVVLKAHDSPRIMFAADQSSFVIKRTAVGIIRRLTEYADVSVFVQTPELAIIGNIAPDQVPSPGIPSTTFGPGCTGPEPLNSGIDQLVAGESVVQHYDSGIRVSHRFF